MSTEDDAALAVAKEGKEALATDYVMVPVHHVERWGHIQLAAQKAARAFAEWQVTPDQFLSCDAIDALGELQDLLGIQPQWEDDEDE